MMRVVIVLLTLGFLAGCNTLEGIGKDLKETGKQIEKAAK